MTTIKILAAILIAAIIYAIASYAPDKIAIFATIGAVAYLPILQA
jgi:nitrate reductase alpha subunit